MPKINFAAVKGVEPVPAGEYVASIVAATEGMSESNYPKIDVQWKIEGGQYDGRRIFETWAFHPDAQFRIKNNMVGLGMIKKDSKDELDVTPEMLIGKVGLLVVTIDVSTKTDSSGDPYPPRNNVKKVKPVQGNAAATAAGGGLFGRKATK